MRRGEDVVYVRDPSLYGPMTITGVRPDGRLECMIVATEDVELFEAHEVDAAGKFYVTPTTSQAGLPR